MDDRQEFRKLVRVANEARQRYSDATREVGRLVRCPSAVGVALTASERETAAMQAMTADTQARIVGEGSLHLIILSDIHSL